MGPDSVLIVPQREEVGIGGEKEAAVPCAHATQAEVDVVLASMLRPPFATPRVRTF